MVWVGCASFVESVPCTVWRLLCGGWGGGGGGRSETSKIITPPPRLALLLWLVLNQSFFKAAVLLPQPGPSKASLENATGSTTVCVKTHCRMPRPSMVAIDTKKCNTEDELTCWGVGVGVGGHWAAC